MHIGLYFLRCFIKKKYQKVNIGAERGESNQPVGGWRPKGRKEGGGAEANGELAGMRGCGDQ